MDVMCTNRIERSTLQIFAEIVLLYHSKVNLSALPDLRGKQTTGAAQALNL